jgi:hypothetical protein
MRINDRPANVTRPEVGGPVAGVVAGAVGSGGEPVVQAGARSRRNLRRRWRSAASRRAAPMSDASTDASVDRYCVGAVRRGVAWQMSSRAVDVRA